MTIDLSATVAPQPLTIKEILEVTAESFVVMGLAYRAFASAAIWGDHEDTALSAAAEGLIEDARLDAKKNLDDWLGDMQTDGCPRFYNKDSLDNQLRNIGLHYTGLLNSVPNDQLQDVVNELVDRDFNRLMAVSI